MKTKKYIFNLDEDKVEAIKQNYPEFQEELETQVVGLLEKMYRKHVKSSVREYIEKLKIKKQDTTE